MTDLIRRLIALPRLLLKPNGRPHPSPPLRHHPRRQAVLPTHRSPYGIGNVTLLDAEAGRLVRPYLTAHDQRARLRELVSAGVGLDTPGPYWIHGVEVA
ncbi:hypothetical protein [Streptomyces sp. NPDC002133]|uniref:hypothetical protein n=1 Tax=Streptomyces sp. NPDC002133 TaxID=3154409 RepID=UPI003330997F